MKDKINKYKLKVTYSSKLDDFVNKLDNKTKKDIDNGSDTNK